MKYVHFFKTLNIEHVPIVGGKNASLGEMYQNLSQQNVNVPNGFATTAEAYWLLLQENDIKEEIQEILEDLDISDTSNLQLRGEKVRSLILNATLPKVLERSFYKPIKSSQMSTTQTP